MTIQNIAIGDTVPIELLITDGAIDQYPQAVICDQDSALLQTLDLTHVSLGNYNSTVVFVMPDTLFVKIVYIVYSDMEHLIVNSKYERDLDIYYKVNPLTDDPLAEMLPGDLPLEPATSLALNYLYRKLRNKTKSTFSLDCIYANDEITELFKAILSDSDSVFTKGKYLSGS